jgi:hypothetical protein
MKNFRYKEMYMKNLQYRVLYMMDCTNNWTDFDTQMNWDRSMGSGSLRPGQTTRSEMATISVASLKEVEKKVRCPLPAAAKAWEATLRP